MWGTSWRQRLRLAPLWAALTLADRIAARRAPARAAAPGPWHPGISVVIPERDAPEMLAEALTSLAPALRHLREPSQVIVVANGAPRATYGGIAERFPDVEWVHSETALGFAGAIERGLARVRHGATYLLNNDMTVAPDALTALLPLRGERTFAVASQILQQDATGRREETGFTDWYVDGGGLRLYHAPVPDTVAAHLCASGGAALFRTESLRRYLAASRAYDPFYWEDVEWGVRAWRDGLEVLFCPASLVAHRHRATTARFYAPEALARIVERNRLLFDLRHGASGFPVPWLLGRVCDLPYESQRELAAWPVARGVLDQRVASRRAPQPRRPPRLAPTAGEAAQLHDAYSYRMRHPAGGSDRVRVVFVTPFAVFPPRHGGARRVAAWIRGQKDALDVALVSDEASLYDARSFADFDGLCDVRLVQRADAREPAAATDLAARTREHCHPALVDAMQAAVRDFRPDVVVVEHAELAPLVRHRTADTRWVLDLHDAYGAGDFAEPADAHRFGEDLASYDALVVCSDEDRLLVDHPRVACLANGAALGGHAYTPSPSARLLFIGPFRYGPNREGITRFLREAWPAVRAAIPEVSLTILGGDEAAAIVRNEPLFLQPGVTVLGHRDDVPALLAASSLAVNPLSDIRGSAIKLVETLAAGRVCVTTAEGARGFAAAPPAGLVVVPDVAAMAEPVVELLRNAQRRHGLERSPPGTLDRFGWHHQVARQRDLFLQLMGRPVT